jgi:hypothetical protein
MPFGLVPVRYKSGAPYNGAANVYYVPAADDNNLFVGDPVIIAGTGDANGVPGVLRAEAGERITGAIVGFAPNPITGASPAMERGYRLADELDYVLVADDPSLLFEATEDGAGGFMTTGDVGNNIDLIDGVGSTYTKKSGFMLDSNTAATTAAGVRIVGVSQKVNNTIGTAATVWQVSIIEATETPAAGTTGV